MIAINRNLFTSTCLLLLNAELLLAKSPHPLPIYPGDEMSLVYSLHVGDVNVPVGLGHFNGSRSFHVAAIELDTPTKVSLRVAGDGLQSAHVRPRRYQTNFRLHDGHATLELKPNQKVVVEVPGQRPLLLFALPEETNIPDRTDPNVLYFGPGDHSPGLIRMQSDQQLYLAPGARVRGRIYGFEAENLVVRGRGVLDARGLTSKKERTSGIVFERCKDVVIEGIQVRTGDWWQILFLLCDDVRVDHLHTLSFGRNNDGVDIDGVTHLTVSDSFIGCGDDGFGWHALDAVAFGEPPTRNCRAERCVVWNEYAGNGLRIGASLETKLFENISFRDIDVLHAVNNAIMVDHSDWAHVHRLTFDRFDNDTPRPLANIAIAKTGYSNLTGYRDRRGKISSILFRESRSSGGGVRLRGAGPENEIVGVRFDRCQIQGQPMRSTDVQVGPYVQDVKLNATQWEIADLANEAIASPSLGQPKELVLDNSDTKSWAFASTQLQTSPCHDAIAGETWKLARLGGGHGVAYVPQIHGRYEISVHWGTHSNLATRAPWTVHHLNGYTTRVMNQNNTPGWKSLGIFRLDENSWVRLVDPHYQVSNGAVVADAVRFRLVD